MVRCVLAGEHIDHPQIPEPLEEPLSSEDRQPSHPSQAALAEKAAEILARASSQQAR